LKKRSCTDILCLLVFAAYVGFMVFLFFYGLARGDFERITNGYDAAGNICGNDNNEAIANVQGSGRSVRMEEIELILFIFGTSRITIISKGIKE